MGLETRRNREFVDGVYGDSARAWNDEIVVDDVAEFVGDVEESEGLKME